MAQDTSNVKYLATFAGADGAQREFQIIDNSGEWVTQQIVLTALSLDEDNSEEIFEPIRVWSGSVSFYSDGITLEDLTPQTSQSLIVKIVRGEETEFIGYLQGESLSQSYGQHGEVLSFTVASRLSVGSGLEYKEDLSCSADNILTLGQLLYDCLKQCGAEDTDAIYLCDSVLLTAEADSPWKLFAAVVDRYRFYKENNDKTINEDYTKDDVSTIVAEILRPFGLMMHEQGANFVITHTNISTSTTYRMLFISQLKDITEANTTGETSTPMAVHFVDGSVLYGTDQGVDYYRGSKKFRVTLNLGLQEVDVFKTLLDFSGFDYAFQQVRNFGGRGGDTYDIKYFQPLNSKDGNVRCYPYHARSIANDEVLEWGQSDDLSTWQDNSKPGCTPIRYIQNVDSTQPAFQAFVTVPPAPDTSDWHDGFIINPSLYEDKASARNIRTSPLISVETKKEYMIYGGRFVLSLTLKHYKEGEKAPSNPCLNAFDLGDAFSIGGVYYHGIEAIRVTNEAWSAQEERLAMHIIGPKAGAGCSLTQERSYAINPTFWHGKKSLAKGCGTNSTVQVWRKGKIKWVLYLGGPFHAEVEDYIPNPRTSVGALITDLSLKYENTEYNERGENYEDKSTRDYYKNSDNGFDGEEKRITTLFGSYDKGAGLALSNMFYNNEPITTIYNGVSDIVIEEALVQQLKKYYDRICEIRTITIKDDATKYYAGDIIAMEDGEFLTLAVSVDYLNGVRKLTVTKIITA